MLILSFSEDIVDIVTEKKRDVTGAGRWSGMVPDRMPEGVTVERATGDRTGASLAMLPILVRQERDTPRMNENLIRNTVVVNPAVQRDQIITEKQKRNPGLLAD